MEPASYDVIVIKFTVVASFPCIYLLEIDRDLRLLRGCSPNKSAVNCLPQDNDVSIRRGLSVQS